MSLCDTCTKADASCGFWEPGKNVHYCYSHSEKQPEHVATPRSSTATLIAVMRALSRDIQSWDGVANAAIAEAAERLAELETKVEHLEHLLSGKP